MKTRMIKKRDSEIVQRFGDDNNLGEYFENNHFPLILKCKTHFPPSLYILQGHKKNIIMCLKHTYKLKPVYKTGILDTT